MSDVEALARLVGVPRKPSIRVWLLCLRESDRRYRKRLLRHLDAQVSEAYIKIPAG